MRRSLTIACSLLLLIAGCKHKDDAPAPNVDLSKAVYGALPYKDGQTVRFIDNSGVVYRCTIKEDSGTTLQMFHHPVDTQQSGTIIEYAFVVEGNKAMALTKITAAASLDDNVQIEILLNPLRENANSYYIEAFHPTGTGFQYNGTTSFWHDTITIGGVLKRQVLEVVSPGQSRFYYNKAQGILYWETTTGPSFTRMD